MAWCRQAASHYLDQCWPRSPTPYGVTRPNELSYHYCLYTQENGSVLVLFSIDHSSLYTEPLYTSMEKLWILPLVSSGCIWKQGFLNNFCSWPPEKNSANNCKRSSVRWERDNHFHLIIIAITIIIIIIIIITIIFFKPFLSVYWSDSIST